MSDPQRTVIRGQFLAARDGTMPRQNEIIYGHLEIDHNNGIIYFRSDDGVTILRITHLKTPTPHDTGFDLVSVQQLTSYPPLQASGD
jgi:hypothetical protein